MRLLVPWFLPLIAGCFGRKVLFYTRHAPIPKMSSGGSLLFMKMVATDSHIELGVEFPIRTWAMGCCSLSAQQVSLEKVLPLDYSTLLLPPLVGVCSMPVSQNEQVAVLPLQSPILSALRELERTGTNMESNVQLKLTRCSCGEYHMCITACRELIKGDVLVPDKGGDPKIIVQFDGSAHRESQVGGAGAALLQFDGNGLALLDWDARVLPSVLTTLLLKPMVLILLCTYMRNTYACVMNRALFLSL